MTTPDLENAIAKIADVNLLCWKLYDDIERNPPTEDQRNPWIRVHIMLSFLEQSLRSVKEEVDKNFPPTITRGNADAGAIASDDAKA